MRGWWLVSFVLFAGLTGCDSDSTLPSLDLSRRLDDEQLRSTAPDTDTENTFKFGFDLRSSPQEDARQYLPFLAYLERTTGYRFRLHFSKKNVAEELGEGVVQFAAIGAASYIHAHEHHGAHPLARGLNKQGKAEYQSRIVVAPNSPIRRVEQLRGMRFAFGDSNSTQGHLIPRIILLEHGITLADLGHYEYTGSHRACANAVASGLADACGMQDTMADRLAHEGIVRILHTSRYYPSSGIAANGNVPQDVLDKVKQALLDFKPLGKDKDGLYRWDRTEMPRGFVAANAHDYDELRQWMIRLDLLKPCTPADAAEAGP